MVTQAISGVTKSGVFQWGHTGTLFIIVLLTYAARSSIQDREEELNVEPVA